MTKQRAEQIIVISLVVMLASTVGGGLAEGKAGVPYYGRKIVGGFLSMLFCSLLAEAAPAPAAYMSMAMSSYAFFHYGLPAINKETPKGAKQPNLHNPNERLPATPGPEVTPEPLPQNPFFSSVRLA